MKLKLRQWLVEGLCVRGLARARSGAFLVLPVVVACSDTTGPSRFVSITPASQSVALQSVPSGKILRTSVTLTNASRFPIIWGYCGLGLEKKIEGMIISATDGPIPPWFTVAMPACALGAEAVAFITPPLQPGESVSIPIEVPVATAGTVRFDGSPGEYRVRLLLATQILDNQYHTLPHDLSVSDSFNVVAQ